MYDGPFFPGFHSLIVVAFLVFWLVVVAGILWALYFVIRTAVTHGILRADARRDAAAASRPQNPAARPLGERIAPSHPVTERPVAPPADQARRDDPRAEGAASTD